MRGVRQRDGGERRRRFRAPRKAKQFSASAEAKKPGGRTTRSPSLSEPAGVRLRRVKPFLQRGRLLTRHQARGTRRHGRAHNWQHRCFKRAAKRTKYGDLLSESSQLRVRPHCASWLDWLVAVDRRRRDRQRYRVPQPLERRYLRCLRQRSTQRELDRADIGTTASRHSNATIGERSAWIGKSGTLGLPAPSGQRAAAP